jgi:hypothetical protein
MLGKMRHIKGFAVSHNLLETKDTQNVIIMVVPHRFDLVPTSCVNKEVVTFNRKLQKIMESFNCAENVNMTAKREHFI